MTEFEHEQIRSKYDMQPLHREIDITEQKIQPVVFFNPLEEVVNWVVMVVVNKVDVFVMDTRMYPIES